MNQKIEDMSAEDVLVSIKIQQTNRKRRERIATAVLAGFAKISTIYTDIDVVTQKAVDWADSLILVLDGEDKK